MKNFTARFFFALLTFNVAAAFGCDVAEGPLSDSERMRLGLIACWAKTGTPNARWIPLKDWDRSYQIRADMPPEIKIFYKNRAGEISMSSVALHPESHKFWSQYSVLDFAIKSWGPAQGADIIGAVCRKLGDRAREAVWVSDVGSYRWDQNEANWMLGYIAELQPRLVDKNSEDYRKGVACSGILVHNSITDKELLEEMRRQRERAIAQKAPGKQLHYAQESLVSERVAKGLSALQEKLAEKTSSQQAIVWQRPARVSCDPDRESRHMRRGIINARL